LVGSGLCSGLVSKRIARLAALEVVCGTLDLVEVNSSFYAVPRRNVVNGWCEQTPDRFTFDLKLHRLLSRHSTPLNLLPPDLRGKARVDGKRVVLTPALEKAVARRFLQEIAPLVEAKKLGALLLQLSPSFRPKTNNLEELDTLCECLAGHRLAVELRNRDWLSPKQLAETFAYFRRRKISLYRWTVRKTPIS
jgi:uncharacterized protein YecE (DUF72 family)